MYQLPLLPYEHQSDTVRGQVVRQLDIFFHNYHGQGQLYSLSRPLSKEEVLERMHRFSQHPYWQSHEELVGLQLDKVGVFEREVFLVLPLQSSWRVTWDAVLNRPDEMLSRGKGVGRHALQRMVRRRKNVSPKGGRALLSLAELTSARQAEQTLFNRLTATLPGLLRATPADVEWLHRSPYYRGLLHVPSTLSNGAPAHFRVESGDVLVEPAPLSLDLADAVVREDLFRVRVEHADSQTSFQSVMAAARVPEHIQRLGDEWVYDLVEMQEFPVDVCISFRVRSPSEARDLVIRKRKVTMGQGEEYALSGEVPYEIYDALDAARGLEQKIKDGQPVVEFLPLFALGADKEGELLRRERILLEAASTRGLRLVHPPGDAYALFDAFFPGGTAHLESRWQNACDPLFLAASGVLGTARVGDPAGQWFAMNALSGKPVWVDWFRAMMEENRTGAAAFLGTLGSGKTNAIKYAVDTMLSWGAMGIVVDPKQMEYRCLVELWPKESVWWRFGLDSTLQFTPFRLGKDARECKQFAAGFLSVLLNLGSDRDSQWAQNAMYHALDVLYKGKQWDMPRYLEALRQVATDRKRAEEERRMAMLYHDTLERWGEDDQGQAMFGIDGAVRTMDEMAQLLVVSIMGLEFPEPGQSPNHWRPGQRFAVAILYLIARLGMVRLMAAPSHVKKFFVVDEAWILRSIPEGRALMNSILLMSRSMNLVLLLGLQNPDVLLPSAEGNDDIAANLGWMFVGRLESEIQVRHAVKLLGLPEDVDIGEYRTAFSRFEKGLGYLRDPYGRIGLVQVDVLDKELLERFSTTPKA
ncbi:ATP-binding protein [Alicyclobacillus tolerans]|uniref:ATP-binding protein n=1 Tax=Alicyclobacillus tolerans TaxID=90970 RepID=UPI003B7F5B9C